MEFTVIKVVDGILLSDISIIEVLNDKHRIHNS